MIERIEGAPPDIVALKAVGDVHASDYRDVFEPAIEAAIAEHGKVRVVYELGPEFNGYSAGAAWEDLRLGGAHLSKWERVAVVTDHTLIRDAVLAFRIFMPGSVKVFSVSELDGAMAWASA